MFQQMGFGVAVALLIDATIIRSVLVPASMKLLGALELVPAALAPVAPEHARRGAACARRLTTVLEKNRGRRSSPESGYQR